MTDYSFYYRLSESVARELIGILPDVEREKLHKWQMASGENRLLYESACREYTETEREDFALKIDTNQAWEQLSCKLGHTSSVCRNKPGQRFPYRKVAAILFLLFCIGGGLLYREAGRDELPEEEVMVVTGGAKALLITQHGEKIQLQDSVIREMVFGNGVSLSNDGMRVIYTGIDSAQNRQEEVYHLLQVPRGGEYRLTLADGTDVWLNSDSRLRYPVYFRSGQRRVYLEGEAYFQVRRDTLHPFIVEAADRLSIEVLGTGFNVQAYPEEKEIYTTLNTGSVKVCHGQQEVVLQPDQQAVYSLAGGPIEIHPVKASRVSAWKDGQFLFEEAELETILLRLGRWYNLDIFYADPEVKGFHFTGDLEKYEDYTLIFKMLEKATKIKFEIKNHTVIVRSVK